jgi:hypothetical protein
MIYLLIPISVAVRPEKLAWGLTVAGIASLNLAEVWMFVSCVCVCVVYVRGLCDGSISRPGQSCRLRLTVCDKVQQVTYV